MPPFSLFVSYLENPLTGSWKKCTPLLIKAATEEEASRTAIAIADFVCSGISTKVLVQIIGSHENGRVVGEIRRPNSG